MVRLKQKQKKQKTNNNNKVAQYIAGPADQLMVLTSFLHVFIDERNMVPEASTWERAKKAMQVISTFCAYAMQCLESTT